MARAVDIISNECYPLPQNWLVQCILLLSTQIPILRLCCLQQKSISHFNINSSCGNLLGDQVRISNHRISSDHEATAAHYDLDPVRPPNPYGQADPAGIYNKMEVHIQEQNWTGPEFNNKLHKEVAKMLMPSSSVALVPPLQFTVS